MKTIEQKAKAYDEALKVLHKYDGANIMFSQSLKEEMFPELKESEDERIRKKLIGYFSSVKGFSSLEYNYGITGEDAVAWLEKQDQQDNNEDEAILHRFSFYSYKDEPNILYLAGLYVNDKYRNKGIGTKILEVTDEVAKSLNCHAIRLKTKKDSNAEKLYRIHGYNSLITEEKDGIWLEKQGEQKTSDKVEPKFKVGDWIVSKTSNLVYRVDSILYPQSKCYYLSHNGGIVLVSFTDEQNYRLWTIEDAKDGDVLSYRDGQWIFIYKKQVDDNSFHYYSLYSTIHQDLTIDDSAFTLLGDAIIPATKEQRDLLFKKMKEEGYEWDAEKKQLKLLITNGGDFFESENCEQKPADKAEPKFKVGDWITNGIETIQIIGYDIDYGYQVDYKGNLQPRDTDIIEKEYHLWNINNAKDGDVLRIRNLTFIFYEITNNNACHKYAVVAYCSYEDNDDAFGVNGPDCITDLELITPATKEQRDLLFQKMKEAGYEWDAEKKELKKIEQKSTWSEEDDNKINSIKYLLHELDNHNFDNWLKSLKNRINNFYV